MTRTEVPGQLCPEPLDELLSLDEAAEIAGRAPVTLRAAIARGKLDGRKVGDAWVTSRPAVSDWLAYLAAQPWTRRGMPRPARPPRRRVARRV